MTSLQKSLDFYGNLGFTHVRTLTRGVAAEVIESAPGQRIELVEGQDRPAASLSWSTIWSVGVST